MRIVILQTERLFIFALLAGGLNQEFFKETSVQSVSLKIYYTLSGVHVSAAKPVMWIEIKFLMV